MAEHKHHHRVFPWWMGFWLTNPLRRLNINPEKVLARFIKPGMRVLEIGPGMGFFTISLGKMVGEIGKVYALDIQDNMLKALQKRVSKKGLSGQVEVRKCQPDSLGIPELAGTFDAVLALFVLHEMPDRKKALVEVYASLKNNGLMILVEPSHVVQVKEFEESLQDAQSCGFKLGEKLNLKNAHGCVAIK